MSHEREGHKRWAAELRASADTVDLGSATRDAARQLADALERTCSTQCNDRACNVFMSTIRAKHGYYDWGLEPELKSEPRGDDDLEPTSVGRRTTRA